MVITILGHSYVVVERTIRQLETLVGLAGAQADELVTDGLDGGGGNAVEEEVRYLEVGIIAIFGFCRVFQRYPVSRLVTIGVTLWTVLACHRRPGRRWIKRDCAATTEAVGVIRPCRLLELASVPPLLV